MARVSLVHDQHGFTIVEVIVAATILVIGVLGVVTMVDGANARTTQSRALEGGSNLARELTEQARLVPYSRAGQDRIMTELQSVDGLADSNSAAAGWQIDRRKNVYTVAVDSCLMDDPNDGLGAHDATYCGDTGASGTADDNPRDYRRVTFNISWTAQGQSKQVRQATILTPRGTADLPRVTSFNILSPSYSGTADAPTITSTTSPISFRATTSTPAAGISWLVEGGPRGVTTNAQGASTWNWDWNVSSVLDGTYEVRPQPFDASGAAGTSAPKTITLNRYAPVAPTPVYAGWNPLDSSKYVDIEWQANKERDVIGYRVYQHPATSAGVLAPGTPTRVCPSFFSTATTTNNITCGSLNPPPPTATYPKVLVWVQAVDRDSAGLERAGATSAKVDLWKADTAPGPPLSPTVTSPGDGTRVIQWTVNPSGDPDTGTTGGTPNTDTICRQAGQRDCVLFYRIYRDGITRYGSTPYETPVPAGTTRRFVDVDPGTAAHCYYITAVDTHMKESSANSVCG